LDAGFSRAGRKWADNAERRFQNETPALTLYFSGRFGLFGGCILHSFFQGADAFANAFAELRKLFRAEYQKRDEEDDQQVHRLKKAF
jgi:hypothetical protein